MEIKDHIKKNYWIIILLFIFLFAYWVRAFNIIPDQILGFDPTYQYRFTKYITDWGHMPLWDELTYYVGRTVDQNTPPLMLYITSFIHNTIGKAIGFSLFTTASYMSAVFGALIVIPAFFLVKKLAGEKAGLLGAFLIGVAPQALIRTFGSSYDTDQMALLFILLNLYLGLRFLEKQTIPNFCWFTLGIIASVLAWAMSIYAFVAVAAASALYFIIQTIFAESESRNISRKITTQFKKYKYEILGITGILIVSHILGMILNLNIIGSILSIIGFALRPEKWIVNISIAELQAFDIFNLQGWMFATGRFITNQPIIDMVITFIILSFTVAGIAYNYKKDNRKLSFILTLFVLGVYTTFRGIRFTEFSSILFLVIIASGFGYTIKYFDKNNLLKTLAVGSAIFLIFIGASLGTQYGLQLGPDINQNWDNAWTFLKTQTPKDAIVGTWWDPGHMIAALAERRNFADGAHCDNSCLYTINDRITDLGKIMATSSESESLKLMKKYKGTSSVVYWIASDDLIAKYQWLQYFGTGCDYKTNSKCELYQLSQRQQVLQNDQGEPIVVVYDSLILLPGSPSEIPAYITPENQAFIMKNIIKYDTTGNIVKYSIPDSEITNIKNSLTEITDQVGITISNETIDLTIWLSRDYSYAVIIPKSLENTVFTKMFFLEGEGLENFTQVFRNEQVKIYEIKI